MGKAKRNKKKDAVMQAILENNIWMDMTNNLGLMAAAKTLTDDELDRFFKAQVERLKVLGYLPEDIGKGIEALRDSLMALRGAKDDTSREAEDVRAN